MMTSGRSSHSVIRALLMRLRLGLRAPSASGGATWLCHAVSVVVLLSAGAWAAVPLASPDVLIAFGSTWKYSDTGARPNNWETNAFDDSAWAAGPAPIGYGDGDLAFGGVGFGGNASNKYVSTQFRHLFGGVADASCYAVMELRAVVDDGAIFYLNGVPLTSIGMRFASQPSGVDDDFLNPTVNELAEQGNDERAVTVAMCPWPRPSVLQDGANVLAVEVHQAFVDSSDIRLDVELRAWKRADCQAAETTTALISAAATPWRYLDTGVSPLSNFALSTFDDSAWALAPFCNQCGYGDGDESTVVANNGATTIYRATVGNVRADCLATVTGDVVFDDCIAIYVNGQLQTATGNMQPRDGGWTFASYCRGGNPNNDGFPAISIALDPRLFVDGDNVIAIEIKQFSSGSSDTSFALNLNAVYNTACLATTSSSGTTTTSTSTSASSTTTTSSSSTTTTTSTVAGSASTSAPVDDASSAGSESDGLPLAVIIGVAAGVAVCCLLIIGAAVFVARKKSSDSSYSADGANMQNATELMTPETGVVSPDMYGPITGPSPTFSPMEDSNYAPATIAISPTSPPVMDGYGGLKIPANSPPGGQERLRAPASEKTWYVPMGELQFGEEVGRGAFGIVYAGEWRGAQVAIKTVIIHDVKLKEEFDAEADLMSSLRPHSHVVQFQGVSSSPSGEQYLITEFCAGGSLVDYLLKDPHTSVGTDYMLTWVRGIASGMLHLISEGIVHRDLAARNVLLTDTWDAKISDFGMSRFTESADSSRVTSSTVGPLKWMAPEALRERQYSEKTDMWSFGVTIFEIVSRQRPYPDLDQVQVATRVPSGEARLELPAEMNPPAEVARLFHGCLQLSPSDRPTFKEAVSMLR